MNEDVFNMQTRRFLKKVGIQSQREIERVVRQGIKSGSLRGDENLRAEVLLRISVADVEVTTTIEDEIALS